MFLFLGLAAASALPLAQRMATKSAYVVPENATTTPPPPGCEPALMLNVLARHGSRHSSHADELDALALRLNSSRAPAWLRAGWRYPLGADAPKDPLAHGDREHVCNRSSV